MTSRLPFLVALCLVLVTGTTAFSWPWSHTPKPPQPGNGPSITPSSVSPNTHLDGRNGNVIMEWRSKPAEGTKTQQGVDPDNMICRLDPKISASTLSQFSEDVSLYVTYV